LEGNNGGKNRAAKQICEFLRGEKKGKKKRGEGRLSLNKKGGKAGGKIYARPSSKKTPGTKGRRKKKDWHSSSF